MLSANRTLKRLYLCPLQVVSFCICIHVTFEDLKTKTLVLNLCVFQGKVVFEFHSFEIFLVAMFCNGGN